jgi:hypothetical protein
MRFAAEAAGLHKNAVGTSAFVHFCSTTTFGLRKMLRIFLIANQNSSHTAGTLYDIKTCMIFLEILNKYYILNILMVKHYKNHEELFATKQGKK